MSCAVTEAGFRLAMKPRVAPVLRTSVPMVRARRGIEARAALRTEERGPAVHGDGPNRVRRLLRLRVVPEEVERGVVQHDVRRSLLGDISRPVRLVPVLSRFSVPTVTALGLGFRVTPDVARICPTPLTLSVPALTVVAPV